MTSDGIKGRKDIAVIKRSGLTDTYNRIVGNVRIR
jgi:hypothetical protein